MKKQNIAITLVLALAMMMVLPMISAATVMVSPGAAGNYSGTMLVNVTTAVTNALSANCTYNLSGGPATVSLVNITNTSTSQTVFSSSVNVASFTGASTYNITCTVTGGTTEVVSRTGVTIDNTNPVVSVSADQAQISTKRPITFTWSATDTNLYTTVGTLVSPDTTKCPTITLNAGSSGTQTIQDEYTDCAGTWTGTLVATDYAGNSNTATVEFRVTSPDGKFIGEKSLESYNEKDSNGWLIVAVIVIILVLWARKK